MFWTNKAVPIAGVVLILLAIGIIINVGASMQTGDNNPFTKDEVAKFLTDVNDNQTSVIVGGAAGIVVDGFLSVAVAALLYILFRDRSRLLATLAFAGLLIQSAISLVVDGNNILLTVIASDFVKGGPTGVSAGDPAILELGRYVGMITLAFGNVAATSLGLGLGALGILIARAPAGAINPPRWLGWVAVFAGACAELAWFVVVIDPAFVFFIGNLLASLVLLFGLGVWLLMHRDLQPAP
ncbi:MAG: DUF4386 domain-containing protein [Chloroflexota bacterium]|nr:DUF4386 domain-containing protein [Chloroflexota bacterium]